jgi:hypothetical protein
VGTVQVPAEKQVVVPEIVGFGHALHTYGVVATRPPGGSSELYWGAGVAADLLNPKGGDWTKQPYDLAARGYAGLVFRAKLGDITAVTTVQVRFVDVYTDPSGGYCSTGCFDDWYKEVKLATNWTKYVVCFAELKRGNWGQPRNPFARDRALAIQFRWYSGNKFDLLLDDMQFVDSSVCP